MRLLRKIFVWWLFFAGLAFLSLLLPHKDGGLVSHVNMLVQMFLCITSIFLVRNEPTSKSRFIFLNLSVLFGFSLIFHIYNFIPESGYLRLFFFQYGVMGYHIFFAFCLGYITIDLMFQEWRVLSKYLLTAGIIVSAALFYYHPFVLNPLYIYETDDAVQFSVLEEKFTAHVGRTGEAPSILELVEQSPFSGKGEFAEVSSISKDEEIAIVTRLYPYLFENNYVVLFVRPIYEGILYLAVLSIGMVILFFGYQYLKDPPQGAYIEKIMFFFFVFQTIEMLHAWSYSRSVEWHSFFEIMHLGQVISIGVLVMIGVFFLLRLRFITSPNGEFYEQEIATSPSGITRWRDMFDELMIAHFLNSRSPLGRLFVDRNRST